MDGMKILRPVKALIYLGVAGLLLGLSAAATRSLSRPEAGGNAFLKACLYILITAVCLLGFAVYAWREYIRRHREHTSDVLFLLITGGALLLAGILIFVLYGGLPDEHEGSWYTAVNTYAVLAGVMPAPFLIRAAVLTVTAEDGVKPALKRAAVIACAAMAAVYILSIALGGLLRFTYAEPDDSDMEYTAMPAVYSSPNIRKDDIQQYR